MSEYSRLFYLLILECRNPAHVTVCHQTIKYMSLDTLHYGHHTVCLTLMERTVTVLLKHPC